MNIKLWYSAAMGQWRWTLTYNQKPISGQESGQRPDLRMAMQDIANTVEHLLSQETNEH